MGGLFLSHRSLKLSDRRCGLYMNHLVRNYFRYSNYNASKLSEQFFFHFIIYDDLLFIFLSNQSSISEKIHITITLWAGIEIGKSIRSFPVNRPHPKWSNDEIDLMTCDFLSKSSICYFVIVNPTYEYIYLDIQYQNRLRTIEFVSVKRRMVRSIDEYDHRLEKIRRR